MKAQDFYSWCIEHERDNLLAEWNYERNFQLSLIKLLEVAIKKCGGNVKKDMNGKPPLVIGESLIDHVQYAKELIHWLKE